MLDYIGENQKTDYVPSFRIDTNADGFKFELLAIQIDDYLRRAVALKNFETNIRTLIRVNLLQNYSPEDHPKARKKLKWYKFLFGGDDRFVDEKVKDIRDCSYIKYIVSGKQIPHIMNRNNMPTEFYTDSLVYDLNEFALSKKHPELVANDVGIKETHDSIKLKNLNGSRNNLNDTLDVLNWLRNMIHRAETMYADRIYINKHQVEILQKLEKFDASEIESLNRILEDAIKKES